MDPYKFIILELKKKFSKSLIFFWWVFLSEIRRHCENVQGSYKLSYS